MIIDTLIYINSSLISVDEETFKKFYAILNSLPKDEQSAKTYNNPNGTFMKLFYNQKNNCIDVLSSTSNSEGEAVIINKIAEIRWLYSNGNNILDFHFNCFESVSVREDGYYYNNSSGLFGLMNNLLKDDIFKIKPPYKTYPAYFDK